MNDVFKFGLKLLMLLSPAVVIAQTETTSASITFSDLNMNVFQETTSILLGEIPQFNAALGTLESWSLTVQETGTIRNGTVDGPYQTYDATCTTCGISLSGAGISGTSWNLTNTLTSSTEPLDLYATDPSIVAVVDAARDDLAPATFNDTGTVTITYTYAVPNPTTAPEIDPASVASSLALLVGGLAVLRGRRPQRLVA